MSAPQTDGLGQEIQFKGYQAEGHDSSHPDYGGNVGRRQGGREEFNFVMRRMKDFNATAGIHINATEYYPEAKHYSLDLVNTNKPGWAWLDQSFYTDQHYDIVSGKLYQRLDEMRADLPELDWVYVDVYFGVGWEAYKLATKMNSLGLPIYTEFPWLMERYVTWNHTSQDWTQKIRATNARASSSGSSRTPRAMCGRTTRCCAAARMTASWAGILNATSTPSCARPLW